jgi:hypothetical protein
MTRSNSSSGNNSKRITRLQVMLTPEELQAVDRFRFEKHMPTRAATVRELLRRGLTAAGFDLADHEARSGEFGVLNDESRSAQTRRR